MANHYVPDRGNRLPNGLLLAPSGKPFLSNQGLFYIGGCGGCTNSPLFFQKMCSKFILARKGDSSQGLLNTLGPRSIPTLYINCLMASPRVPFCSLQRPDQASPSQLSRVAGSSCYQKKLHLSRQAAASPPNIGAQGHLCNFSQFQLSA